MRSPDFRPAIRRALKAPCCFDFLAAHRRSSGAIKNLVNRTAFMRCCNLLLVLKAGDRFNSTTLAKATGTTTKTINRDIEFLRKRGVRIDYLRSEWTYRIDRSFPLPPQFQFTGGAK